MRSHRRPALYLLAVYFCLSTVGFADIGGFRSGTSLKPLFDVVQLECMVRKFNWELWSMTPDEEYGPILSLNIPSNIEAMLDDLSSTHMDTARAAELVLIEKHALGLESLFNDFGSVGGELPLFFSAPDGVPIRFVAKEDKTCLLLSGFASDKVYNTLRTSARGRATKVLTPGGTSLLSDVYERFQDSGIDYFGVVMVYGSKDFLDESRAFNEQPEAVCLVASSGDCGKFVNGEITETKFLNNSDVYLSGRGETARAKKIEIKQE